MAIETLELQQNGSSDAEIIERVHNEMQEDRRQKREKLLKSPELRATIANVATVRKELGDPKLAGTNLDTVAAYSDSDFEALYATMGVVNDFRTRPDRSYGERWEVQEDVDNYFKPRLTPELEEQIYETAKLFPLTGDTIPKNPEATAGVALGGGGFSLPDRVMNLKSRADRGEISFERLVALGSERKIDDAERKRAGEFATNAETEFDLAVAAAEQAYGIKIEPDDITIIRDNTNYDVPHEHKLVAIPENFRGEHPEIVVLSAGICTYPYVDVPRNGELVKVLRTRANTEDTYRLLANLQIFKPGDRLLISTNAHFAPFQGAAAANEFAKQGIETEVLGYDPKTAGRPPKRADELLQEMLTAVNKLRDAAQEI